MRNTLLELWCKLMMIKESRSLQSEARTGLQPNTSYPTSAQENEAHSHNTSLSVTMIRNNNRTPYY